MDNFDWVRGGQSAAEAGQAGVFAGQAGHAGLFAELAGFGTLV